MIVLSLLVAVLIFPLLMLSMVAVSILHYVMVLKGLIMGQPLEEVLECDHA